jgi:hypothetical protein
MAEEEPPDRRMALFGLLTAVVIIAVSWWVARAMYHSSQVEDCLMSGRSNCSSAP